LRFSSLCSSALPSIIPNYELDDLDATKYELEVSGNFMSCRISWYSEMPAEWKGVAEILSGILDYLRRQFE